MRSRVAGLVIVCVATFCAQSRAGLNDPISFTQAGTVTLTLDVSVGGFDHIIELTDSLGAVGVPVMALTESFSPSADVLGYTPANISDSVSLGTFAAGEELIFRLTNVGSSRFGDVGVIDSQVFSGTSSSLNPSPTSYYTYVQFVDASTIKVAFEDIIGISPTDPDPIDHFVNGDFDVAFTLTLVPVPEPTTLALLGYSTVLLGLRRRGL